jgi:hypothetical protein
MESTAHAMRLHMAKAHSRDSDSGTRSSFRWQAPREESIDKAVSASRDEGIHGLTPGKDIETIVLSSWYLLLC